MAVLKALAFLALVSLAAAARMPEASWQHLAEPVEERIREGGHPFEQWLASPDNKRKDQKAYIAFKYYVAPEKKDAFVDMWRELEKSAKDEKGMQIFDLKKTMSDNLVFLGYGEWKSFDDYMDHFKSDYTQKFLENLKNEDVTWTITALEHPDVTEVMPGKGDATDEKQLAHVLIKYVVAPHQHEDFMGAWDEAAKATADEKGAHIYSLRKVAFDNYQFWTYGTWKSMRDFVDHFKSDHIRKLTDTLDKYNVIWHMTPLHKIGDQPE
jgi:quinol monooxygenase YgiN